MFKSIGNLASMIRQAQQMGGKMQAMNDKLRAARATASTGAGMVEVEVNGLGEVLRVSIDPILDTKGDREMIESLLPGAINQAVSKARLLQLDAMKGLTEGMNMPALDQALDTLTESPE